MCHNPIYCILPPHVLNHMAKHGDAHHKDLALNAIHLGERLRGQREILSQYELESNATGMGMGMMGKKKANKFRIIQTADNTQKLKGTVVRKEGQAPTGDAAVDEAYNHSGDVFDFYHEVYNRNSVDDKGAKIYSTVHYGKKFDNAFWNGERMVYGDGDGTTFQRFTKCLEVIGHELTHGVSNTNVTMLYEDEPGALNEAISDVFGSLALQKKHKQTAAEAEWVIGIGLFTKNVDGVGIRSLKAPGTAYDDKVLGKDPCPALMKDYVDTKSDNGGIHINCTIPSHAFYLAAVDMGGYAWEDLGQIWYNTVTKKLPSGNISFQDFADLTMKVAHSLYGNGQATKSMNKGWKEVGVL